ncbi:hypothetical protein BGV40_11305 [Methanosarcina sp. Ant1]|nr:hypothetical protein BGV40_11305 [Methanosarcina sp. Ant1]
MSEAKRTSCSRSETREAKLGKRNSGSETRVIKEESLWTEIITEQKRNRTKKERKDLKRKGISFPSLF